MVSKFDLSERIHFADAVEDIQDEYQKADAFVLPSRFEGYGMVFAEAIAAGLPVIAAHSGAVPEVVPQEAGLLVAPDDTNQLKGAIQQLITDAPLRKSLQDGARQVSSSLPSWQDSAKIVARMLEEISVS